MNRFVLPMTVLAVLLAGPFCLAGPTVDVVVGPAAPALEKLAARELEELFGTLFTATVKVHERVPEKSAHLVLVGSPATNPAVKHLAGDRWPKLSDQGHVVRSVTGKGQTALVVGGASPVATLWAVRELAHHFGVRSYLHADAPPARTPTLKLDGIDIVREPVFRDRAWRILDAGYVGGESWGLADQKRLITQLSKLRFNRVVLSIASWQPFLPMTFKGVKKTTALLGRGLAFPVDGDTGGRHAFRGATRFENPDLSGKKSIAELQKAGVAHIRGLVDAAHARGMTAAIEISPLDTTSEFKAILGRNSATGGRATDATDRAFVLATIRGCVESYPALDAVVVRLPDAPAWSKVLSGKLEELKRKDGTSVQLILAADSPEHVKGISAAQAVQFEPGGSVRRLATGSLPPGTNRSLVLPLTDDSAGVLPQLCTSQLHTLLGGMRKAKWNGYVVHAPIPGDLDPTVHYLARASFDARFTAAAAYDDLITAICGQGVVERVGKGFEMIEKATDRIDKEAPGFATIGPNMVMKHDQNLAAPAWIKEVKTLYAGAMNEMYRGQQRAPGRIRPLLVYHAKRLEFALGYLDCVAALHAAGEAKAKKDRDARLEQVEKAIESIYNGLNALAEVARDPSDRAVIAVLNAFAYRPLRAELERLDKEK